MPKRRVLHSLLQVAPMPQKGRDRHHAPSHMSEMDDPSPLCGRARWGRLTPAWGFGCHRSRVFMAHTNPAHPPGFFVAGTWAAEAEAMRVTVTVGPGSLRLRHAPRRAPAKAQRAMVEGLNEGGDKTRTPVRRDLRDQTDVKAYGFDRQANRHQAGAPGKLSYEILGTGKGNADPGVPGERGRAPTRSPPPPGVSPTPSPARSRPRARAAAGAPRAGRMPIRALYGPSVAKEIVKDRNRRALPRRRRPGRSRRR